MSLTLYYHPLSSYCQKVLIALYENETPFTPKFIDLGDATSRAELTSIWPIGKFPVLRDEAKGTTVPESSIIIEYLAQHYPGKTQLVPTDPERARQARFHDRFYDLHISDPMQKIVGDKLRPAGKTDAYGVETAKRRLQTAYGMIDRAMARNNGANKSWAVGDDFTMADCAAAPALFYAGKVVPFGEHMNTARYFDRLMDRPSFARAVAEAKPYYHLFPG